MIKGAEEREQEARDHIENVKSMLANDSQIENGDEKKGSFAGDVKIKIAASSSDINEIFDNAMETDKENTYEVADEEKSIEKLNKIQQVNEQTTEKDFKPSIRLKSVINAMTESLKSDQERKPTIKINENQHHSADSSQDQLESEDKKKIEVFKARNVYGHSTDSQIQNLIYNHGENSNPIKSLTNDKETAAKESKSVTKLKITSSSSSSYSSTHTITLGKANNTISSQSSSLTSSTYEKLSSTEENEIDMQERVTLEKFIHFTAKDKRVESINFDEIVQPYDKNIGRNFNESPSKNMIASVYENFVYLPRPAQSMFKEIQMLIENEMQSSSRIFSYDYLNIEEILNRILYKPIQTQLKIINKSIINHFLFDLKLEEHLAALRSYMFFENGEFAQTFVDHLADRLFVLDVESNSVFINNLDYLLSPIYMNEALTKAVSRVNKCKYAENLSIRINTSRQNALPNDRDLFKFLSRFELAYKLDWPLNIIVNEDSLKSYNKIFGFLLQIKFVLAVLNNVWHVIKRLSK